MVDRDYTTLGHPRLQRLHLRGARREAHQLPLQATEAAGLPDAFDPVKTICRFEDICPQGGNDHQLACAANFYSTPVPGPARATTRWRWMKSRR